MGFAHWTWTWSSKLGIAYLNVIGSSVNPNKKEQQCENYKPDIMALKLLKILIGVNKYHTSIFSFNIKKKNL